MNWHIKNYEEIGKLLSKLLLIYNMQVLKNGSLMFDYGSKTYRLSDNGGETTVELININSFGIPHNQENKLEPFAVAYRIATYINKGYKYINWQIRKNKTIEDILNDYMTGNDMKGNANFKTINIIDIINSETRKEV